MQKFENDEAKIYWNINFTRISYPAYTGSGGGLNGNLDLATPGDRLR